MKRRKKEEDPAPRKGLTTYTIKLDEAQFERTAALCDARGWEPYEVPYARYAFRGPDVNVVAYQSGKLVVQGGGTEDFVINILEPEVTGQPKLGYDEVLHPEWFEPHAGLDESGKGDFFGPVVTACVVADKSAIDVWVAAGIRDSKRIADPQILKLDAVIRGTSGATAKVAYCGMAKYNELMSRPGANLNRLLAWLHSRSLDEALNVKWVPWGMLDQFSTQPLVQRLVKDKKFDLRMRTRAEEDPVVAAASVVARAEYLRQMRKLSDKFGGNLQKGAGPLVRQQATEIVHRFGARSLGEFAKLHFRTAYEVVAALGKLDELPLPPPKPAFER